jgi:hypothetical protein
MKVSAFSYIFYLSRIVIASTDANNNQQEGKCIIMDPETGTCQADIDPKTADQIDTEPDLVDNDHHCARWAEEGECDVNVEYVSQIYLYPRSIYFYFVCYF